jgi:hypothetical protein
MTIRFGNEARLHGHVTRAGTEYRSRFGNWHERASVRVKPKRVLDMAGSPVCFPPELVPVTSHSGVARLGPEATHRILAQRLYRYLHFTIDLEEVGVIPVTMRISRGRSGLDLPEPMLADAYAITTDEAWHAQFSYDLVKQMEAATGIDVRIPDTPRFIGRLHEIRSKMAPELAGLDELSFAIVSETLISAILSDIPNDQRLPAAVRDVVRDHAEDEGKHHAYFHSVLRHFWPALDRAQRRKLGPWLPGLIQAFLEPDYTAEAYALLDVGLKQSDVELILAETYPENVVVADIAQAARTTVRYFTEVGALDDPATRESFAAAGLVDS